ncbi:ATP-binding protein [Paenibacillus cellulosilyticus]|uniref:ATP-binding protein n=1 Tax=Paenibacillus cellulosilyticus TaxID=375489 RepID=UPI003CCC5487
MDDIRSQVAAAPYTDHWAHWFDELRRLDLLLHMELRRMTFQREALESMRGELTLEEMGQLLDSGIVTHAQLSAHERMQLLDTEEELRELGRVIEARCEASARQGAVLPLYRVAACFKLDAFERDCLLLASASLVDVKYGKLFGLLHNDVTRQYATVALALRLRGVDEHEPRQLLRYWVPGAALRRHRLLELQMSSSESFAESLMGASIKLEEGIAQYLLEPERLDSRLSTIGACLSSQSAAVTSDVSLREAGMEHLAQKLAASLSNCTRSTGAYLLYGGDETALRQLAYRACSCAGVPLLLADMSRLPDDAQEAAALLQLLCREAQLRDAAIGLLYADQFNSREHSGVEWEPILAHQANAVTPILLFGSTRFTLVRSGRWSMPSLIELELPLPTVRERAAVWTELAEAATASVDSSIDWLAIAEHYKLTGSAIREAWQQAETLAYWRAASSSPLGAHAEDDHATLTAEQGDDTTSRRIDTITAEDIREACRRQKPHRLGDIATRILPRHRVDSLVLTMEQARTIRQIISQQKQRHRVLTEWNFHGKLSRGKGTNVLFTGPPGTGKTMAAEAIAGELGLDLYRIDLSQVISKYIGETEKNLRRLFQEAEYSNAVLLFDEADALFGKRSEVKDSHDRHANTEVAYLLQKMEEYDGMSILATNLSHNMDEAFARRMAFRIEFPVPEPEHRYRLWQSMFPVEAPRGADIDLAFLSRQIRLSGGGIKNAVLTAAYLAADEGEPIGMRHLVRAVKQEFDKLGKLSLRDDFGPYYDWIG